MTDMSTVQELKLVLKETLENRGVLGQMKACVRSEVFHALDDKLESPQPLSSENMLINELIREYLDFNNYKYATSVLMAESGQPKTPLDRSFLANELNISEDRETANLPLLYGVLSHFLQNKESQRSQRPRSRAGSRRMNEQRGQQTDIDGVETGMNFGEQVILPGAKRRLNPTIYQGSDHYT